MDLLDLLLCLGCISTFTGCFMLMREVAPSLARAFGFADVDEVKIEVDLTVPLRLEPNAQATLDAIVRRHRRGMVSTMPVLRIRGCMLRMIHPNLPFVEEIVYVEWGDQ
jgi:hypothetical protein